MSVGDLIIKRVQKLLDSIEYPTDLRKLGVEQLPQVCKELREFIIDVISENPGHFGASLGVIELTVALHYALKTPYDKLVWDVGHQAYSHKILTGRKAVFATNRKYKGISGFPKIDESEYDAFGVGHASTSISAALGMAVAAAQKGEKDRQVVAIIGDGALTGGMAFEALNHAGELQPNILIIVNDNNMAIDANTGALNQYLLDISTSQAYNKLKDDVWKFLGKMSRFGPNTQYLIQNIEIGLKSIVLKSSNLFESLGFRYFGPIDGHDVVHLVKTIEDLRKIPGPKVLHCITKKGKGFAPAELSQTEWHAPGKFNKVTGEILKEVHLQPQPPKYQDVFGHTLVELAKMNPRVVGVTPAMASGCSMTYLMEAMPERTFDVGIAEQHAVTFSAGMAIDGMMPFCNIYSSFMQRAYDQVIHDVALQNLNVVFCLDRAGLVGSDGATHHGTLDIAFMRAIPNMTVAAPMNERELRNLMYTAQLPHKGPFVIRYPRGNGENADWRCPFEEITIGKGRILREGENVAIISVGPIGNAITKICERLEAEGISIGHFDARFVKPLDAALLHHIAENYSKIITVEDGTIVGGFGSAVIEFFAEHNIQRQVVRMGIPDSFIEHGTQEQLQLECGFDHRCLYCTVKRLNGLAIVCEVEGNNACALKQL
jgi:1-deoxy-D-xylulose-5-phosphate synthase